LGGAVEPVDDRAAYELLAREEPADLLHAPDVELALVASESASSEE
jgi:hypothetical protein